MLPDGACYTYKTYSGKPTVSLATDRDLFIASALQALIAKMPYLDTDQGVAPSVIAHQRETAVKSAIAFADLIMERR
jgi:hypothetical protein